jgi:hypothetical protein
MKSLAVRLAVVIAGILIVAGGITFYVARLLRSPTPFAAAQTGPQSASLVLGTTPAVGKLGGNPTWVSYLARENGQWKHTTVYDVPAHSLVRITIYNFDGASGLRNPYLSQVQGTVGGLMRLNGRPTNSIGAPDASHTFTVPQYGVVVPILGVADDAPNQCPEMPCSLSQAHTTVTFTIRTGEPGRIRWQCFVPCAAGFIDGFSGPMQTIGYMDGFLHVV